MFYCEIFKATEKKTRTKFSRHTQENHHYKYSQNYKFKLNLSYDILHPTLSHFNFVFTSFRHSLHLGLLLFIAIAAIYCKGTRCCIRSRYLGYIGYRLRVIEQSKRKKKVLLLSFHLADSLVFKLDCRYLLDWQRHSSGGSPEEVCNAFHELVRNALFPLGWE